MHLQYETSSALGENVSSQPSKPENVAVKTKKSWGEEEKNHEYRRPRRTGRSGSEVGGRSVVSAPWDMNDQEGDTDASRVEEDGATVQAQRATRNIVRLESELLQQRKEE